ncbi:hypothetical protein NKH77_29690 [Streptomyces sp. M19]
MAAAGAVIALGAVVGAPSASADDDEPTQPWAEIQAPGQVSVPTAADAPDGVKPQVGYQFYDGGNLFPKPLNVKLTIDASGLDGIAKITSNSDQCTASGAVVTCADDGSLHAPWEPVTLTALPEPCPARRARSRTR